MPVDTLEIRMPCSMLDTLILPDTPTYGTATVTGVTSLVTGLYHAPSAPQAQAQGVCKCRNTEVEAASVLSDDVWIYC
eukprot:775384-Rhodomonas_salina.1